MWTKSWFEAQAFEGWKTFGELTHADLPETRGVYVVLTDPGRPEPEILLDSVGGTHKHVPLTDDPEEVKRHWQPGAEVLYIGKAASAKGLYQRLWAYARQGRGFSAGHRGGRYLWQLPESDQLTVAWRPTPELNAHDVEDALLTLYIETWDDRPFANLKDGKRYTPDEARATLGGWLRPES